MKKSRFFLILFTLVFVSSFAQAQERIRVFIAPVAASSEQAAFFKENFEVEAAAAGYVLAGSAAAADYILRIDVSQNTVLYADGSVAPAPSDEKQFLLILTLIRGADNVEMVSFSFPYNTLDEMLEYNPYLFYRAMSGVPFSASAAMPSGGGGVKQEEPAKEKEWWMNKWVYIRASVGLPITFYKLVNLPAVPQNFRSFSLENGIGPFRPDATVGVEFHYIDWMSSELSVNLSLSNPIKSTALIPTIQFEQKFPIKPNGLFMIEPYGAVSFPLNTLFDKGEIPKLGVGGGLQLAIKAGSHGGFFADAKFIHFLGDRIIRNVDGRFPNESDIHYTRYIRNVIGISLGYKIGFRNRD